MSFTVNDGGVKHVSVFQFGDLVAIDVTDQEGLGETVSFVTLFEPWHKDPRVSAEIYLAEEFDMLPTRSWYQIGNLRTGEFAHKRNYKASFGFSALHDICSA